METAIINASQNAMDKKETRESLDTKAKSLLNDTYFPSRNIRAINDLHLLLERTNTKKAHTRTMQHKRRKRMKN